MYLTYLDSLSPSDQLEHLSGDEMAGNEMQSVFANR